MTTLCVKNKASSLSHSKHRKGFKIYRNGWLVSLMSPFDGLQQSRHRTAYYPSTVTISLSTAFPTYIELLIKNCKFSNYTGKR